MNNKPTSNKPISHTLPRVAALFVISCFTVYSQAQNSGLIPLPKDVLPGVKPEDPLPDSVEYAQSAMVPTITPKLPDAFVVRNLNGQVDYDSETRSVTYTSGGDEEINMRTSEGQEIFAREITAHFEEKQAELKGPLLIYQGDSVTRAQDGDYDWEKGAATGRVVRAKVNGLIVRGSRIEYKKDAEGKNFVEIYDAYVSAEDVEKPDIWVGMGKLTVYPGDYGTVTRLSLSTGETDMVVPIFGWMPISHSLNPKEGYLPMPGAKSIWGSFLKNRYGILLGNRRVEHGMPVSDYIATLLLDYRSRRGYAGGLEITDEDMHRKYKDIKGFNIYYAADKNPSINPTRGKRVPISKDRYKLSLQALWQLPQLNKMDDKDSHWSLAINTTTLSDRYMLRDYFEDIARVNDKPDNTVRLVRRTPKTQLMLFDRFTPNDYYSSDRRTEISYYRVRSTIGNSRIAYETRNSAGLFKQFITESQRTLYTNRVNNLRYEDVKDYYLRLLNTSSFYRVNTTHELSTNFHILRFLNVTPKVGGGYTGYYGVDTVGSDNRVMGYLSTDFDIKFNRHFKSVRIPSMGIFGLYHIFHPYATISHGTISSSNPYVPQLDTWSTRLGGSTVNPMPLDLMSFTGVDGWANWTIWRLGTRNTISTTYDGESRTLIDWNLFVDYNIDNPNSENKFSNLYSILKITPVRQVSITLETQTPTICHGDEFKQYNTSLSIMPTAWLEVSLGHRYIKDHPVQRDASQMYTRTNLRINERYTASAYISWDKENHRLPIQQYSFFRKFGAWYMGTTFFLRNNGGKREKGMGVSFTLGETDTSLPINLF